MSIRDSNDLGSQTPLLATAALTAHVAMAISRLDSGVFVEANEAFCRLVQYTREELLGHTSVELGIWQDPQQRQRLIDAVRRQGSVSRFEARYRNRLGESGDMEVSARLVEHGGTPYMIGFLTEVTAQRELIEGLRVAQSRLDVALRASGVLVFRQDHRLRYTWVANPALGATEGDLIGRTDEEIMGVEEAVPLLTIKRRVLESGVAERRDVWVANGNQLGCFDLVVEPERDAAGRVVGIVCAAHDITQRMTAHRESMRAPMNTIRGMSALIGREPLTPRQALRLRRIDSEAERLAGPPPAPAIERLRERHAGALVLVAEQNPVLLELVQNLLEQAGLRVVTATTGVEAFSFALKHAPSLMLLDLDLPQSGGVAAAMAVRTMAPRPIPIIAMMSASPLSDPTRALDADLDDLLDRPTSAERLYDKVLAWLEAR